MPLNQCKRFRDWKDVSDVHAGPLLTGKQGRRRPDGLLCSGNVRPQKDEREQATILLVRRAPTMKGLDGHPNWSCAPGRRALRRMGRVVWSSSCSRNAHDRNVLVRCAQ